MELYADSAFTFTRTPIWTSAPTSVIEAFVLRDVDKDGIYQVQQLDTVTTDSIHVFRLENSRVEDIVSVSVNGSSLAAGTEYCTVPGGNWISTREPLRSGDQLEVMYLVSDKQDLAVSNWDSNVGNYLFYNRRIMNGIISRVQIPSRVSVLVFPNPFNSRCRFEFHLEQPSDVHLTIYDMLGKEIRQLGKRNYGSGIHRIEWDGRDENAREIGSGMYLYRLIAGESYVSGKLLFMK